MNRNRTILSVVGPHANCGKTSFVVALLRHFARTERAIGCLKISPAIDWPDGTTLDAEIIGTDFYLESTQHLTRPGKDTALYLEAGAAEVRRLQHRDKGLSPGLTEALDRFGPDMPVIVESSSAVSLLDPVAVILIVRPPLHEMKPATEAILPRVTDLLINASEHDEPPSTTANHLTHDHPTLRPQFTWHTNLHTDPLPTPMLTRLQTLLA